MIIATTNDLELVTSCGCPCDTVTCAEPRKQCQSLDGTISKDLFAPYTQPAGDPTDDIATLYETMEAVSETIYGGSVDAFLSEVLDPGPTGDSREEMLAATVGDNGDLTYTTDESHYWDGVAETCTSGVSFLGITFPSGGDFSLQSDNPVCNATSHVQETSYIASYGTAHSLQGCPGPFPDSGYDYYWNVTKTDREGFQLTNPYTKLDLRADAVAELATSWPDPATGTECTATFSTNWPKIEDINPWPDCDDGPPEVTVTADVRKSRYRLGVPAGFSTVELPRSTYEVQWDEVFFPEGWDRTIDDPDYVPPDPLPDPPPPIPQIPDPDAPPPVLIASKSWSWGGDMDNPWSDWFELDVPEEPGESRIVNMMVICYRSSRIGQKPTAFGEVYVFPT